MKIIARVLQFLETPAHLRLDSEEAELLKELRGLVCSDCLGTERVLVPEMGGFVQCPKCLGGSRQPVKAICKTCWGLKLVRVPGVVWMVDCPDCGGEGGK